MFDPVRIGRALRAIRIRLGLRQLDVARRAGVSRAFVSSVERGRSRAADIRRIEAICSALGAELDVRVRWRGEGLDRLLDEAHASLVDQCVSLLRQLGWEVLLEVTFNEYGDRGSIDVLAWHPRTRSLLIVEVKSVVPDAQATLAPLDRRVRIAPKLAHARGWEAVSTGRVLVVRDITTNRTRVSRFESLFDAALPDRGRAVRRRLRDPRGTLTGLLFLPDVPAGSARRSTAGRTRVNPPRSRRTTAG